MAYLCTPKTEDSVAQQVEHNTFNVGVLGSSPSWITKTEAKLMLGFCFCVGKIKDIVYYALARQGFKSRQPELKIIIFNFLLNLNI